jgi:eukaryotic-like serine/threonine-protein kinase
MKPMASSPPRDPTGARGAVDADDPVIARRYRVEASLGRGGMGEVLRAFDLHLGRQVALKRPLLAARPDPAGLARFRREARAAASLAHPNVVAVHDVVLGDGTPYLVMELVQGRPLSEVLADGNGVPIDQALGIAIAIADALEYAHAMGVVHRDVKPANVMVTVAGGVKVLDFGIARSLSSVTPTDAKVPFGTPEYLSPEQIRAEPVDGRADIYALGCVLHEMLTGRPPFAGDPIAIAYRHLEERPIAPSVLRGDIPQVVDTAVLRCLQKAPTDRFQRAGEVASTLRRLRAVTTGPFCATATAAPPAGATGPAGEGGGLTVPVDRSSAGRTRLVRDPATSQLPSLPVADRRPRGRRVRVAISVVVLTLLAAGAGAVAWSQLGSHAAATPPPKATSSPRPLVLLPPRAVRAQGQCDGFIRFRAVLSWTPSASDQVLGYAVYRDDGDGGAMKLVTRLQGRLANGFVEHGLGSATTYRYVVRSTYGAKVGPPSPVALAATPLICMG